MYVKTNMIRSLKCAFFRNCRNAFMGLNYFKVLDSTQKHSFIFTCRIGDITKLSLEAIIHPTNESLTDKNPISNAILEAAGPELKEELKTQVVCKF